MDKIILLILFSIIGSVTKGNAQLQCYVCSDCPHSNELDSNSVYTCGTPDDPDITTTDPEDTTTTDPEDTTETDPDEITITNPDDTTTTDPGDTTTTTDEPITTQTTPEEPPTTTPQTPEVTTATQTNDGGITTQPPPITPPSTTPQIPVSPTDLIGHKYRRVKQELLDDYNCFVVHQRVGDAIQVNRGCVVTQETHGQTCSVANSGVDPEFCRLCSYNECNVGSKHAVSLVIVLSSLFVVLAMRFS